MNKHNHPIPVRIWVTKGFSRGQAWKRDAFQNLLGSLSLERGRWEIWTQVCLILEHMDLSSTFPDHWRALYTFARQGGHREEKRDPEVEWYVWNGYRRRQSTRLPVDTEMVGPEATQNCILGNTKCLLLLIKVPSAALWSSCQWVVPASKRIIQGLGVPSQRNACD